MKKIYFIILLIISGSVSAQITDTIEVGFTKSVYLIFPQEASFDKGSESVIIKIQDNKVIIQALEEGFEETNLFVQSGAEYYMFILRYSETPKKLLFNYQIRNNQVSNNTPAANNLSIDSKQNEVKPLVTGSEMIDYNVATTKTATIKKEAEVNNLHKENSLWVQAQPQKLFNNGTVEGKTTFLATNIYVYEDYFYFKLVVKNDSKINYDIDFIKFTIKNKSKSIKKAADQFIELVPEYIMNKDNYTIPGQEKYDYVFVFKKFTIENNKKLTIEIWEKNGDRKIDFDFSSKDILNIKRID